MQKRTIVNNTAMARSTRNYPDTWNISNQNATSRRKKSDICMIS